MGENLECYVLPKDIKINKRDWIKYKDIYETSVYIPKILEKDLIIFEGKDNIVFIDRKIVNENQVILISQKRLKLVLKYRVKEHFYKREDKCEWEEISEIFQNAIKRLELTADELAETLNEIKRDIN